MPFNFIQVLYITDLIPLAYRSIRDTSADMQRSKATVGREYTANIQSCDRKGNESGAMKQTGGTRAANV